MTVQDIKQLISKLENKKQDSVFLRTDREGFEPHRLPHLNKIHTAFGFCPVINLDQDKVYFMVTLHQLKMFLKLSGEQ